MLAIKIPAGKRVYSKLVMRWLPDGTITTLPKECKEENYYGEMALCGPAVALIGAGMSIGLGISMPGIMGGIMIAGGIASGLGALTGNKFLSNLGMGLNLVGGIGGSLVNAVDGTFANPFSDGYAFANTATGQGLKTLASKFSGIFGGDGAGAATAGQQYTQGLTADALGGASLPQNVDYIGAATDVSNPAGNLLSGPTTNTGSVSDLISGPATTAAPASGSSFVGGPSIGGGATPGIAAEPAKAASGSGLLKTLKDNGLGIKDILDVGGRVADAYQAQPVIDAKVANLKASTNQLDFETQNAKNRVNNLQFQNVGNLPTGSGVAQKQLTPTKPGVGVHVVAMPNGQVVTLDDAQFALYQQQIQQGTQNSGAGLLRQGVPA